MAESLIGKLTRNIKRAANNRGASAIRDMVDRDETTENTEFMISRGKETWRKEHNRKAKTEGEKIHLQPIPSWTRK